jgi:hypothetical protein
VHHLLLQKGQTHLRRMRSSAVNFPLSEAIDVDFEANHPQLVLPLQKDKRSQIETTLNYLDV